MFQQVAAQLVGVTLTRIQVEDQHRIIKADIVKPMEAKPQIPKPKKSSVCSLQ